MTATMPVWNRAETQIKTLTVVDDMGAGPQLMNLNDATAIEYQVKTAPGAVDPPLIGLAIGTGVTVLTQAGSTLGQARIEVSSTLVDALAPGYVYEEVCVVWDDGRRTYPIPARKVLIKGVVNRP